MAKEDNKTMENKRKILEDTLEEEATNMLTNTSCLAIGNIFIRKHPLLKILWCIAFVLCTILTINQLYNLSASYFSYPLNTIIKLKSYQDTFPSITFCNLNPLRKSKINVGKPELQSFLQNLEIKNFTADNITEMDTRLVDELIFTKLILNESSETRRQMGHQMDDFILQCYYLGRKCKLDQLFIPLLTNKFGNCFTFNPINLLRTTESIDRRSRDKGLFITFYVENNEYLPNFIPSSGVRIHFHETNSREIPDNYGMTLPTGFEISLGVVPTVIRKLQSIKGSCEEGKEFNRRFNAIYTLESCYTVCMHELIYKACGCFDAMFQLFQGNITNSICDTDAKGQCLLNIANEFDTIKSKCNCKEACNSTLYDVIESFSTWPATSYEKRFFNDLSDIYPKFKNLVKHNYKTRKNFTNILIYIEKQGHKEIYQIRAYQWDNFLSDIGGTLNLYLGFSVLTAFEFLESISLLVTYLCGKVIYRKTD